MTDFTGFEKPQSNYFKVPNSFWMIDDLTIHEKFVLLYILRHTWGYQEFGIMKRITVDEFQNGRKQKDGTRMDNGCGVSRGAISKALHKLEELQYIAVETDDSDAARIKKSYMLNMQKDSVHHMNTEFTECTQRSQDGNQRSPDAPRTEKETKKETTERKITPFPPSDKSEEAQQGDAELVEMEDAVKTELKQYNKNQRRNVAKSLLKLHGDPDKDIAGDAMTPEKLKAFCKWWDKTKIKNEKPITRPKNMGSIKAWVDDWQENHQQAQKIEQDNAMRRHLHQPLPLNYASLEKGTRHNMQEAS